MKMNKKTTIAAAFVAAFAVRAIHAEYNVIDTDFPMSGPTAFTADAGVTNVYSGLISGTGPAIIGGGGTVVFSHADNTYTGGTTVNDAVFRLDADGCAGSGAITAAVNTAHVYLNCDVVHNDMYFAASYFQQDDFVFGTYPKYAALPIFPLKSDIRVMGEISAYQIFPIFAGAPSSPMNLSFEGEVKTGKGNYLRIIPYGRLVFKNRVTSSHETVTPVGFKSSAKGVVEFHSSSNEIPVLAIYNPNISLFARDALYKSMLHFENGSEQNLVYLNGKDQTFRGIVRKATSSYPSLEESNAFKLISEDNPAVVRITGFDPTDSDAVPSNISLTNRIALSGKVSFVMDVDPDYTAKGFFQAFHLRLSDTTGDIIVSNGDFRVTGTASFPNVPNIYVGEGGLLTNASTKPSAFAGCRNLTVLGKMACAGDAAPFGDNLHLTLGNDAEFSLPAEATVTVKSLKLGETDMPDGIYGDGGTPVAQILQGTVVVRKCDRYVDCTNGNDANDGAFGRPFKTIRAATENALYGDIIHVAPGTYGEAEGTQAVSSKIGTRVVVPEGVTLESTGGAANTFIVGALATGDQIDKEKFGMGTNGVRCVYACAGAVVRGFTLTGGRGIGKSWDSGNGVGAAFYSEAARAATVEDCVISNNGAYAATIYQAVVRRCLVIGNKGISNNSGSAGYSCDWYGTVIDDNESNGTVFDPHVFENCTIGPKNVFAGGGANPNVLKWDTAEDRSVLNSAILGGKFLFEGGGRMFCTNCLISSVRTEWNALVGEQLHDTIFTNDTGAVVDADYRPVLGQFAGIDRGDSEYSTEALGDTDLFSTPRVLNGVLDIGAVEHDWRPAFSSGLGQCFKVMYASPSVIANATGGLLVPEGVVAGTVRYVGLYELSLELTGGRFEVHAGGELAYEGSGSGEQIVRFSVTDTASEVRFAFVPDDADASGAMVLKKLVSLRGLTINIR